MNSSLKFASGKPIGAIGNLQGRSILGVPELYPANSAKFPLAKFSLPQREAGGATPIHPTAPHQGAAPRKEVRRG